MDYESALKAEEKFKIFLWRKAMGIDVENYEMETNLEKLKKAIERKSKKLILHYYEEINLMNFDLILTSLLDKYDELVEQGNDILYS